MIVVQQLRYYSFILIATVSLHACSSKPSDGTGSATDVSSKTTNTEWFANMNDAYAQSVKDHKPILAYFTASDTCGLCKQLETNVFSTPLFKSWAENSVVLLQMDFSKHNQLPDGNQEQYAGMAQYLKVTSYPTVWIVNVTHEVENGRFKVKPIGKAGFEQTPERFLSVVQNYVKK
jgi:protein disulfide-isomerase